jgi:hypothetical protein
MSEYKDRNGTILSPLSHTRLLCTQIAMNHNSTNADSNGEYVTMATAVPYVPEDL